MASFRFLSIVYIRCIFIRPWDFSWGCTYILWINVIVFVSEACIKLLKGGDRQE